MNAQNEKSHKLAQSACASEAKRTLSNLSTVFKLLQISLSTQMSDLTFISCTQSNYCVF